MSRLKISCVNKVIRSTPYEQIRNIGGVTLGKRWKHTLDQVITNIESGVHTYYVHARGRDFDIVIAQEGTNKYLKTLGDTDAVSLLTILSECPPSLFY
jgi:hypothetical protein